MKNKHVTRFGYPASPGGALYYASDYEGLAQTALDLERARLLANGFSLTTKESDQLMAEIRAEQLAFVSAISAIGIPDGIRELLEAPKKSKASTIARNLAVTEFDLFLLVQNRGQMGFKHRSKFPDYVPDHLAMTDLDTSGIREGRIRKVSKKLVPYSCRGGISMFTCLSGNRSGIAYTSATKMLIPRRKATGSTDHIFTM